MMQFEEIAVLNRIIYPYNIAGNSLTQYEAFERVQKHLDISSFKSKQAKSIWSQLERLYSAKMPFNDMFFEFGALGDVWSTSGVNDISKHIEILEGVKYGNK
ncbi:hypothetical protein ACLHDG_08990 [Sulfurovum sp. CS9]|uniref:hypothetical protein n=1 Tax=Sulfurovum sp. CS9 TaxID=3391146 RepID=UPI0039E8CAFD